MSSVFPPVNTYTVLRDLNHPIPEYTGKNIARYEKQEYCHGKGVTRCQRGSWNSCFPQDWKSMAYSGPGYYVPSERRWIQYKNRRDLPPLWKPDLMHIEDEETWIKFQRTRDRPRWEMGLFDQPSHLKRGVPVHTLQPRYPDAINRKWNGAGSFSSLSNKWIYEHEYEDGITEDSIFFCNEEDWLKYKYYGKKPWLDTQKKYQ